VIDTAFAVRSTEANQQAFNRVAHTYAVIDQTQDAFKNLVNMETGYRGFLLTGDGAFLEPYVSGRLAFTQDLTQLKAITPDNPAQMARWQDLEQRAAGWQQNVTEPGIALRRQVIGGSASLDDLVARVSSSQGKQAFDGMRNVFAAAEAVE